MRKSRIAPAIGLTAVIVSLAGCAGVKYPNYYVLNLPAPPPAATGPAPVLGSVAVREFDAPSFLRGGSIVYRESAAQLGFYDYHRWAADPRRAVTGAVIQEMQSRGIFRSVVLADGHETPDWLLTGSVDHLEEVDAGGNVSVQVGLSAQLVDSKTGEVLWQSNLAKTANLEKRSVPGVVAEMCAQMNNVVKGLVSSMQTRVAETSPALKGLRGER